MTTGMEQKAGWERIHWRVSNSILAWHFDVMKTKRRGGDRAPKKTRQGAHDLFTIVAADQALFAFGPMKSPLQAARNPMSRSAASSFSPFREGHSPPRIV